MQPVSPLVGDGDPGFADRQAAGPVALLDLQAGVGQDGRQLVPGRQKAPLARQLVLDTRQQRAAFGPAAAGELDDSQGLEQRRANVEHLRRQPEPVAAVSLGFGDVAFPQGEIGDVRDGSGLRSRMAGRFGVLDRAPGAVQGGDGVGVQDVHGRSVQREQALQPVVGVRRQRELRRAQVGHGFAQSALPGVYPGHDDVEARSEVRVSKARYRVFTVARRRCDRVARQRMGRMREQVQEDAAGLFQVAGPGRGGPRALEQLQAAFHLPLLEGGQSQDVQAPRLGCVRAVGRPQAGPGQPRGFVVVSDQLQGLDRKSVV